MLINFKTIVLLSTLTLSFHKLLANCVTIGAEFLPSLGALAPCVNRITGEMFYSCANGWGLIFTVIGFPTNPNELPVVRCQTNDWAKTNTLVDVDPASSQAILSYVLELVGHPFDLGNVTLIVDTMGSRVVTQGSKGIWFHNNTYLEDFLLFNADYPLLSILILFTLFLLIYVFFNRYFWCFLTYCGANHFPIFNINKCGQVFKVKKEIHQYDQNLLADLKEKVLRVIAPVNSNRQVTLYLIIQEAVYFGLLIFLGLLIAHLLGILFENIYLILATCCFAIYNYAYYFWCICRSHILFWFDIITYDWTQTDPHNLLTIIIWELDRIIRHFGEFLSIPIYGLYNFFNSLVISIAFVFTKIINVITLCLNTVLDLHKETSNLIELFINFNLEEINITQVGILLVVFILHVILIFNNTYIIELGKFRGFFFLIVKIPFPILLENNKPYLPYYPYTLKHISGLRSYLYQFNEGIGSAGKCVTLGTSGYGPSYIKLILKMDALDLVMDEVQVYDGLALGLKSTDFYNCPWFTAPSDNQYSVLVVQLPLQSNNNDRNAVVVFVKQRNFFQL